MNDFIAYISTSFALIFVIEGLLYALFPDGVKKMFTLALSMPAERLRIYGLVMAITGLCLVMAMSAMFN